jgi:hypothetical protein
MRFLRFSGLKGKKHSESNQHFDRVEQISAGTGVEIVSKLPEVGMNGKTVNFRATCFLLVGVLIIPRVSGVRNQTELNGAIVLVSSHCSSLIFK